MLATTTQLTTDIVAMPLLWVLPLGLYLLSFVIAFSTFARPTQIITLLAPVVLLAVGGLGLLSSGGGSMMVALASLAMLFIVAVALHGYLYHLRPAAPHLTLFYLVMSAGGVLGGLLAALRSEEHTSELQSLMRISYAVFCLKKKTHHAHSIHTKQSTVPPKVAQHNNTQ